LDDPRACYKLGFSLGQTTKYEVKIIGRFTNNIPAQSNIHFKPYCKLKSAFLLRIIAPFVFFISALAFKPRLIIFCSWELIIPSFVLKFILGCKLIYDIQEDYPANVRELSNMNHVLKSFAAKMIEGIEKPVFRIADKLFLAEKIYLTDKNLDPKRCLILENKAILSKNESVFLGDEFTLLFTGTIASSTGIFEAIELARQLNEIDPKLKLVVSGQVHEKNIWNKLLSLSARHSFIQLNISFNSIPYHQILESISKAHAGIISYRENAATKGKIPTKLFEYAAHKLPILLLSQNKKWEEFIKEFAQGLPASSKTKPEKILLWLKNSPKQITVSDSLLWVSNEPIFLAEIESILGP
jgi:glycosyltransferase involved in cell wall biosynthesis